ncbi:hypothetical protein M8C21_031280, partial [Ambrosia artemisiifolia]
VTEGGFVGRRMWSKNVVIVYGFGGGGYEKVYDGARNWWLFEGGLGWGWVTVVVVVVGWEVTGSSTGHSPKELSELSFHTCDYARHFVSACTWILGLEGTPKGVEDQGRLTHVAVFPIGSGSED